MASLISEQIKYSSNYTLENSLKSALFVSNLVYLNRESAGGAQICTQEYIETIEAAGFSLSIVTYKTNRGILTQLKNKIWNQPYGNFIPTELIDIIVNEANTKKAAYIFLNQVELGHIAKELRKKIDSTCRIVVLSHGLESTDIFHGIRTKNIQNSFNQVTFNDVRILGKSLIQEGIHRQYIDYVFCLSPLDVQIERWLGAKNVIWIPRTIKVESISWQPQYSRIGFVGTINHHPSLEGLVLFLEAFEKIAPFGVSLRLVGGESIETKNLIQRFPIIEYLGRLSNQDLKKEAGTWNCFIHPIFCYPRGCSTKLATALSWQIPIVTTPAGCRGYSWKTGKLSLAETPESMANLVLQMLNPEVAQINQKEVVSVSTTAPSIQEIGEKIREFLYELN
ncbi:hypothetical protein Sta7437_2227 [Stanieria cyanosphaera PCC 7437]|uniref:Glycosyl transferase group 1 n=1 Tax=Stanieria cyanosphaera (strain ATCC 29371 / PCC 7437) TaxID=111780 RepID=K9XT43_STAC7|nr:glycosyltransferase [Stanieria cyanosphaera]AFZ35775.1 hypothetical protein Sta7437_2227 [Stanieria cyanosphaera PCC 7437]